MSIIRLRSSVPFAILFATMLTLAVPVVSFAQGRGRGRGPDLDKKCSKFVNCHDARDGRWDGRGPQRSQIGRPDDIYRNGGIWRNDPYDGIYYPRSGDRRIDRDGDGDIDRYDDIFYRRSRNRRVDRDGDGDFDRNDIRLGRHDRSERVRRVRRSNGD